MNKIYKVIWSKVKNQYVVVSELAHSNGKQSRTSRNSIRSRIAALVVCGAIAAFGIYGALPTPQAFAEDAKDWQYAAISTKEANPDFNGYSYHRQTVEINGQSQTFWVRDGYHIDVEQVHRYDSEDTTKIDNDGTMVPMPVSDDVIRVYRNDDWTEENGEGLLSSLKVSNSNMGITTLNGKDLQDITAGTYIGASSGGGTEVPSNWNYLINENGKWIDVGNDKFSNYFTPVEYSNQLGGYTYDNKLVDPQNVYFIDGRAGVFLVDGTNGEKEVYKGSVYGAYNEILVTGKDSNGNYYSYWGAERTDPNETIGDKLTVSQYNDTISWLNNNIRDIHEDDIKQIQVAKASNGGTIGLQTNGEVDSEGNPTGGVNIPGTITIQNTENSGKEGNDVKIRFGSIDENKQDIEKFTIDAGSKVVGKVTVDGEERSTEGIADADKTLTGLEINGVNYALSQGKTYTNGDGIVVDNTNNEISVALAKNQQEENISGLHFDENGGLANNLSVQEAEIIEKDPNTDHKNGGNWSIVDTAQPGNKFTNTTLVGGTVEKQDIVIQDEVNEYGSNYLVKDTDGNTAVLEDVASASKLKDVDVKVGDLKYSNVINEGDSLIVNDNDSVTTAISKIDNKVNAGWTAQVGETKIEVNPTETGTTTLNFAGDNKNIDVTANKETNTIEVALKDDIDVNTVTVGETENNKGTVIDGEGLSTGTVKVNGGTENNITGLSNTKWNETVIKEVSDSVNGKNGADKTEATKAATQAQLLTVSDDVSDLSDFAVKYDVDDKGTPDYSSVTLNGEDYSYNESDPTQSNGTRLTNVAYADVNGENTGSDAVNVDLLKDYVGTYVDENGGGAWNLTTNGGTGEGNEAVSIGKGNTVDFAGKTEGEGDSAHQNIHVTQTPEVVDGEQTGNTNVTFDLDDKLVLGNNNQITIDGSNENATISLGEKITLDGVEGTATIGGVNITTTTVDEETSSTIGGLTNTTWKAGSITSGQAATEDQLKVVDAKVAVVHDDDASLRDTNAAIWNEAGNDKKSTSIALGKDAKVSVQNGRKASAILFGSDTYTGGIAIGEGSKAFNATVNMGVKDYTGEMGDVDLSTYKTYEAMGVGETSIGSNSYISGTLSTNIGSYNIVSTKYGQDSSLFNSLYSAQNFGSIVVGTLNSIESSNAGMTSGVANNVIGMANKTNNTNGSLVFGTGNEITNSTDTIPTPSSVSGDVTDVADNFREAVSNGSNGGAVLAIGGGNKADYALNSQLIGVQNKITGTSGNKSEFNMVDGYQNTVTNGSYDTIIGTNNSITNSDSNIVLGDNHIVGTNDTSANNNIILGSSDNKATHTASDTVVIGHNAQANYDYDVAIGSGSVTEQAVGTQGYAGANPIGTVSVGSAGNERTITNVAAGRINEDSTDAVNGSQLYATNQKVDAGWTATDGKTGITVSPTNNTLKFAGDNNITVTADTTNKAIQVALNDKVYLGGDHTEDSRNIVLDGERGVIGLGSNIALDGRDGTAVIGGVNITTTAEEGTGKPVSTINGLSNTTWTGTTETPNRAATEGQLQNAYDGSVKYWRNEDGTYDKSFIQLEGGEEGTTITHLKDGVVAEYSTEAINGSQLWETQQQIKDVETTANKHTIVSTTKDSNLTVKNVAGEGEADNYQVALKDDITLKGDSSSIELTGTKGTIQVNQETAEGTNFTNINGNVVSIGYTNSEGIENAIVIDGGEGTITGLSNTTWDGKTDNASRVATEGQLEDLSDTVNTGWIATDSQNHEVNITPDNNKLNFAGDENITVTAANNEIKTTLNDDIVLGDYLNGDDGVLIGGSSGTISATNSITVGEDQGLIIDGQKKEIQGLSNTTWNEKIANDAAVEGSTAASTAATQGQLQEVSKVANAGWTASDGTNSISVKPNETLNFVGDENLTVSADGTDKELKVSLNDDITLGDGENAIKIDGTNGTLNIGSTFAVAEDGTVLSDGDVIADADGEKYSLSEVGKYAVRYDKTNDGTSTITLVDGDDLSGTRIKNVADGVDPKDAVNVSQLEAVEATANAGWNASDGTNSISIKPNETLGFVGDENLTVSADGTDKKIKVSLNDNINLNDRVYINGAPENTNTIIDIKSNDKSNSIFAVEDKGNGSISIGGIDITNVDGPYLAVGDGKLKFYKDGGLSTGNATGTFSVRPDGDLEISGKNSSFDVDAETGNVNAINSSGSAIMMNDDSVALNAGGNGIAISDEGILLNTNGINEDIKLVTKGTSVSVDSNGTTFTNTNTNETTNINGGTINVGDKLMVEEDGSIYATNNNGSTVMINDDGIALNSEGNGVVVSDDGITLNANGSAVTVDRFNGTTFTNTNTGETTSINGGTITTDTVKGLSNTTWNDELATQVAKSEELQGTAATQGQLQQAVSAVATEAAKQHTTVSGDDNLTVKSSVNENGGTNYQVTLDDDITLGNPKAGNTEGERSFTINTTNPEGYVPESYKTGSGADFIEENGGFMLFATDTQGHGIFGVTAKGSAWGKDFKTYTTDIYGNNTQYSLNEIGDAVAQMSSYYNGENGKSYTVFSRYLNEAEKDNPFVTVDEDGNEINATRDIPLALRDDGAVLIGATIKGDDFTDNGIRINAETDADGNNKATITGLENTEWKPPTPVATFAANDINTTSRAATESQLNDLYSAVAAYDVNVDGTIDYSHIALAGAPYGASRAGNGTPTGGTSITNVAYASGKDGSEAVNVDYLKDAISDAAENGSISTSDQHLVANTETGSNGVYKPNDDGNVNLIVSDEKGNSSTITIGDVASKEDLDNLKDDVGDLDYSKVEGDTIIDGDSVTTAIGKLDNKIENISGTATDADNNTVTGGKINSDGTISLTQKDKDSIKLEGQLTDSGVVQEGTSFDKETGTITITSQDKYSGETSSVKVEGIASTEVVGATNKEDLATAYKDADKDGNATTEYITDSESMVEADVALDHAIQDVAGTSYANDMVLSNRIDSVEKRLGNVEERIDKVGAMAAAIANLRTMGFDPEAPTEIAIGVGQYKSETGIAIGVFHYPNQDFMLSASLSSSGDELMGGIGATWKLGRKSAAERAKDEEARHLEQAEEMKKLAQQEKVKAQAQRHAKLLAERQQASQKNA